MNLMPIDIKLDLTPIAQSLAAIMDSGHKGVAKLVGLFANRAFADAIRNRALQDAQNHFDGEAIRRGEKRFEDCVLMDVLPDATPTGVVGLLGDAIKVEEVSNFVKALGRTAELLENIPQHLISDEPIQKTFFNRWRKEVELVDDEKLREIWAQILASEVSTPKSISLRTLDVLRNLSEREACVFQNVIKGEIDGCIPIDSDGHTQYGTYSDALMLQDVGLLFAQDSRHTFLGSYAIDDKHNGTFVPLSSVGIVACMQQVKYALQCYLLTDAGKCLLRVAQGKRTLEDIKKVFMYISDQSHGVGITLHAMLQKEGPGFRWNTIPLWSNKVAQSTNSATK